MSETHLLQAHSVAELPVFCPQGTLATGGGYHLPDIDMRSLSSYPLLIDGDPLGWMVVAENAGEEAEDVESYAVCATG